MAKKKTKKRKLRKKSTGSPAKLLGFLFIFVVTLFSFVLVLKLPPKKVSLPTIKYVEKKSRISSLKYEEPRITLLEKGIKKVDRAIFNAVVYSKVPKDCIEYLDIKKMYLDGEPYFFQSMGIRAPENKINSFIKNFFYFLKKWSNKDEITIKRSSTSVIHIYVFGRPTHVIYLSPEKLKEEKRTHGEIVLIIDDIGRDIVSAKKLINLFGNKVNLSILPYSLHAKEIDEICRRRHIPTLLHMPMEPIGYPEYDPGIGALFTNMNNKDIKLLVNRAISRIPYIKAVNNHMGSKFTQDKNLMKVFLYELKKKHLFFIDSYTTPKSISITLSKKINIPVFRRDIFIDNKKDVEDILLQLKKAEAYSLKKGIAIVIGHPYRETLKALNIWKEQKNPNVHLVSVTTLLRKL